MNSKAGRLSFILSFACAIHCLAMPFLIVGLSVAGLSFALNPIWEILLVGMSSILAFFALKSSRSHHKKSFPFYFYFTSIALLLPGLIFHNHYLIISGSVINAIALFTDFKISKDTCTDH